MHVTTEPTIPDGIDFGVASQMQRAYDELTRAFDGRRGSAKPPRIYRGRQVLAPGKRKAARHPWANRFHAARTGGFVVDQTHPDTPVVQGSCYGCGWRGGFVIGDQVGQATFEAEIERHQPRLLDGVRECCLQGVVL